MLLKGTIAGIERFNFALAQARRVAQQLHELGFKSISLTGDCLRAACGFFGGACCGLGLLVGQAREAFRRFYGAEAPKDADTDLRSLLLA